MQRDWCLVRAKEVKVSKFCNFYALVISCSLSWKLLFGVPSYIPQIYTKWTLWVSSFHYTPKGSYCSKSRSSNIWLLQRTSQCSVQMNLLKLPSVTVLAQNTSGLNFRGFRCLSSHPQIFSSKNWEKVLHNCCKNGRRIRWTILCSIVAFVAYLGTNINVLCCTSV